MFQRFRDLKKVDEHGFRGFCLIEKFSKMGVRDAEIIFVTN
jgi:hypothetical protein